jgi:hypothetical protein
LRRQTRTRSRSTEKKRGESRAFSGFIGTKIAWNRGAFSRGEARSIGLRAELTKPINPARIYNTQSHSIFARSLKACFKNACFVLSHLQNSRFRLFCRCSLFASFSFKKKKFVPGKKEKRLCAVFHYVFVMQEFLLRSRP